MPQSAVTHEGMMRFAAVLALGVLGSVVLASAAAAKSAKDCEAIKNPMEYNLCLASLSPVRGSPEARRRGRRPPDGETMAAPRRQQARTAPVIRNPRLPEGALRVENGRVRLAITPR